MFSAISLAGCGNSCFVGNGQGGVTVKAGNPPHTCFLKQAKAAMRVVALKSAVCETCTADVRVENVFVTTRSIQLRPMAADDKGADWVEIAPKLANEPRQIDLVGNSIPEILVENASVPAGNYREIRAQFFSDVHANAEKFPADNACGVTQWNGVVMTDGHVEPIRLSGDVPELIVAVRLLKAIPC